MYYFFGQPVRFVENKLIDVNLLSGVSTPSGDYVGYRTSYEDVEEIVDRKYWQPSTVAVAQVGRHPTQGQSMYDSDSLLQNSDVARLNASIRHPGNDIVDTTNQISALKKITIEVAEADIRAQLESAESSRSKNQANSVPHTPSVPPESTITG